MTLDLDFANPLQFQRVSTAASLVLRLPSPLSNAHLLSAIITLAGALETELLSGNLWIVEIGRIRIYLPKDE